MERRVVLKRIYLVRHTYLRFAINHVCSLFVHIIKQPSEVLFKQNLYFNHESYLCTLSVNFHTTPTILSWYSREHSNPQLCCGTQQKLHLFTVPLPLLMHTISVISKPNSKNETPLWHTAMNTVQLLQYFITDIGSPVTPVICHPRWLQWLKPQFH